MKEMRCEKKCQIKKLVSLGLYLNKDQLFKNSYNWAGNVIQENLNTYALS
jgi:hypothetical protein